MKAIKSIFDKSYIVKAQAEAAGAKEWPQGNPPFAALSYDESTRKYRWVPTTGPSAEALVGAANIFKAFVDVAAYKLKAQANPQNCRFCPECGSDEIYVGWADDGLVKDEDTTGGCHQCDWMYDLKAQKKADAIANANMGPKAARPRLSSCLGPTKKVWHIADSMPKASRKDVMDECVRQGIAYGTARTQYQAWFKASQNGGDGSARKPYEKA